MPALGDADGLGEETGPHITWVGMCCGIKAEQGQDGEELHRDSVTHLVGR